MERLCLVEGGGGGDDECYVRPRGTPLLNSQGSDDAGVHPLPTSDKALFFLFTFKICLHHWLVMPFLRGTPSLEKFWIRCCSCSEIGKYVHPPLGWSLVLHFGYLTNWITSVAPPSYKNPGSTTALGKKKENILNCWYRFICSSWKINMDISHTHKEILEDNKGTECSCFTQGFCKNHTSHLLLTAFSHVFCDKFTDHILCL